MNIYYAPPSQVHSQFVELTGQEAKHASKVMRAREGDKLTVVDGEGGRYDGTIARILDESIQINVKESDRTSYPHPEIVLGLGIIKKRDRLEFAVEKAVELGAAEIGLFRCERTVKENVRMERLQSKALSAMKQSLRAWLPDIRLFDSPGQLVDHYPDSNIYVAHEKINPDDPENRADGISTKSPQKMLLMIGPEGGFSVSEVKEMKDRGAKVVSLGPNRLRAETAAIAFLSQFL
ncbi:16S rRNA (uracil1498-N3)-methyltransferase [Fodinibius salinus]|uniref:Ribosomal RNA small subunit methyltransferase E n=1 Tax=Fodinibius salinus TaxID=860790 RepID=A0A5D3YKX4_9BACT|nr:RsmE family RNA methyltransferase [Fodinibius salinus]TYP94836.1 16S rRNA (uracil1498-N3)-methyltransferase [Fodinibius salinus]